MHERVDMDRDPRSWQIPAGRRPLQWSRALPALGDGKELDLWHRPSPFMEHRDGARDESSDGRSELIQEHEEAAEEHPQPSATAPRNRRERVLAWFERRLRSQVIVFGRPAPVYRVFALLGIAIGSAAAIGAAIWLPLSLAIAAGVLLLGLVTAYGLGLCSRIVVGHESYTFYHYQILLLTIAAAALWWLHVPVLPYLDLLGVTLCCALAVGRVGCFLGGCCHGVPHLWGVRYGEEHAATGFPSCFVGVRLLPVQLVELMWLLGLLGAAGALVYMRRPPGEVLSLLLVGYSFGRFFIELGRGDLHRIRIASFSEAQWTALAVLFAVAVLGWRGALPFHEAHAAAAVIVVASFALIGLARLFGRARARLWGPDHVGEIADILQRVVVSPDAGSDPDACRVQVGVTSQGICLSGGTDCTAGDVLRHYSMSSQLRPLTEPAARTLSRIIGRLQDVDGPTELQRRPSGVFHLLVGPGRGSGATRIEGGP